MSEPTSPTELNLRGLKCPMPALRVAKALRDAPPGARFIVTCTDPMAAIDIPNLMRETGGTVETTRASDGVLVFHIRKTAA